MYRRTFYYIIIVLFILVGLAGCVSKPLDSPTKDYFSYFSEQNDLYVYVPVKENEDLLNIFVSKFFTHMSEENVKKIVSRTNYLFFSAVSEKNILENFQAIIVGNIPKTLTKSLLSKKNGWSKKQNYYIHNSGINLLFGDSNELFISSGDPNKISIENHNYINFDYELTPSFLYKNPLSAAKKLFGNISLSISQILGNVLFYDADDFYVDLVLYFQEKRAIKPTQIILKLSGIKEDMIEVFDSSIKIKNFKIKKDVLLFFDK